MTYAQTYSVFEPEIWSPRIDMFFRAKLLAANFFANYSDEVTAGGDRIHIPGIADSFSASDINVTSGDITATDLSDTKTTLTIDTWKGAKFVMSDFQAAQVAKNYRLKEAYAQAMGYALAKTFDSAILALGASITPTVGNSATDLLASTLENAMGIMDSNSVPTSESAFFFHPKTYWTEVMLNSKLYDASQFGKATLPYGAHDMLYGVPTFLTPQVPVGTAGIEGASGHRNLLIHKGALAYALGNLEGGMPSGVRIKELPAEALRTTVVADIMYGVKILKKTGGVRILSKR